MGNRNLFQNDQVDFEDQDLSGDFEECCTDTGLDGYDCDFTDPISQKQGDLSVAFIKSGRLSQIKSICQNQPMEVGE